MKKKRPNIFILGWRLLVKTAPSWNKIASNKISAADMRKHYVFPWIAICVLVVAVFDGFYATDKVFERAFLNSLLSAVSLTGAYFLSNSVCYWYLRKQHPGRYTALTSEKIVCYSFTIIYILKILITVLPSLFYVQILSIYTAYLIWEASRALLHLEEEERGNIVMFYTLMIILTPKIIIKVIEFLLPNI